MGYPVRVPVSAQPKGSRDTDFASKAILSKAVSKAAASVQLTAVDFTVGENVEALPLACVLPVLLLPAACSPCSSC